MKTVSRLIDWFIPEHYALSLALHRQQRRFEGTVTLQGNSQKAGEMRLHAKGLAITDVTVNGREAGWASAHNDELIITSDAITIHTYQTIVVTFHGTLTDSMHGLYPCYFEHEGVKKELLATQFESHHAREAFPCLDEPAAKATFDVTLTTEADVTVLGNMPVAHQTHQPGSVTTTFETTPRMSTYLLAWVVGELQKKTTHTKRGVEVSVWATVAQPADGLDWALDIARRSIDFYEEYFHTDYPLPKSDHVALPDFSSGAMENWGLITYREIALLAPPATTSISNKQYIATVVAHELAHQWFGNLVTMKWWNDLWLNESFADMMEYLATDSLEPSWNMWLDFSAEEALAALRRDSIDGVQPVQLEVHHPDEINTLFDPSIVYAKGGRLLHMLHQYVGDKAFRAGLAAYFKQHAYGNTEGNDLWHALAEASGKNIEHLMQTWISQPGYPVVTVTRHGDTLKLTQQGFFVGPHRPSHQLWPIPLDAGETLPVLFDKKQLEIAAQPVQLNRHDSGHFITAYDDDSMATLLAKVHDGTLPDINRLQLLNEAMLLARGGIISSARLIELLPAYRNETNEPVWDMIAAALAELRKFVEPDSPEEKALRTLTGTVAHQQYKRLGWQVLPDETEGDTKLRSIIISLMIYSEDAAVISKAKELFETGLDTLDPQLRAIIISAAVRYADQPASVVDALLKVYRTTSSAELQLDITAGISAVRANDQITRLLDCIKDSQTVRPQDAAYWFVYLLRNRDGRTRTWAWIRDNWPWVMATFKGDKSYDMYPRYIGGVLSTKQELDEYIQFFTPLKNDLALTRVIAMAISEIGGRIELIARDSVAVRAALLKR